LDRVNETAIGRDTLSPGPFVPEDAGSTDAARRNIQRDGLEGRVLNALRYHLMDPALFKEFCDEFTGEMNRLRMEGSASAWNAGLRARRKLQHRESVND